jgi:hypothetical protein
MTSHINLNFPSPVFFQTGRNAILSNRIASSLWLQTGHRNAFCSKWDFFPLHLWCINLQTNTLCNSEAFTAMGLKKSLAIALELNHCGLSLPESWCTHGLGHNFNATFYFLLGAMMQPTAQICAIQQEDG